MAIDDHAYAQLQRHLDRQTLAFPATRSGSEIRLLKQIFSPREALAATCLTYRFESFAVVFARAGQITSSAVEMQALLDALEQKGGIGTKIAAGQKFYYNLPLVVGFFEAQAGRLTPEFIKAFDEYTANRKFGLDFISTKLPQMRTIPIAKSIQSHLAVSTFDEVTSLLKTAEPPFVILECICRQKKALLDAPCRATKRLETCLAAGTVAQAALRRNMGREITQQESISILAQNQKDGLVLQPSNTRKAEFICSCCGCCCGMLGMQKKLPVPVHFWTSNFYAVVDSTACNGCGHCEQRCQVNAVRVSAKTKRSVVDLNRCIGCGLCIPVCPQKALTLEEKTIQAHPPEDLEELFGIIMSNKKGPWRKLKVAAKLIMDAIRTRQTHLPK